MARADLRREANAGGSARGRGLGSGAFVGELLALECGHNRSMSGGEKSVLERSIEVALRE